MSSQRNLIMKPLRKPKTNSGSSGNLSKGRFPDLINLKEIVLKLRAASTWSSDAALSPGTIRILDCKTAPMDKKGLSQLVELNTQDGRLDDILKRIRQNPEVMETSFSDTRRGSAIGRILSRHTLACRTLLKSSLFCRTCLFHTEADDKAMMEWTLVLPDGHALNHFLGELESANIEVEIKRISKIVDGKSLTPRQHSIIHIALDRGYFDYPRKVDLSVLAKELKMSKSNLSEILRRGAKKVLTSRLR